MATEYHAHRIVAGELPPRSALLRVFREPGDPRLREHRVLEAAGELAECHGDRQRAIQTARRPGASSGRVAACAQQVDDIDRRRAELIERIDRWVATNVAHRAGASLHTETLGAVIDRMAAKWIVAQQAVGPKASIEAPRPLRMDGAAHLEWTRLAELADGYQDLITDVAEHRRRLPVW
ncbi:DUF4254 domain-containing protein [Nocardia sp. NPDC005366]|uniref:DUF4254 domain-containing protein n=1 Tax=Nocardia sp. NPDC005366 TaxID=3156878 RepID=UPI0033A7D8E6